MARSLEHEIDPQVSLPTAGPTLLTMRDVMAITTFSRPSIYRLLAAGRFPKPIKLSANKVAFLAQEIEDWVSTRPRSGTDSVERKS